MPSFNLQDAENSPQDGVNENAIAQILIAPRTEVYWETPIPALVRTVGGTWGFALGSGVETGGTPERFIPVVNSDGSAWTPSSESIPFAVTNYTPYWWNPAEQVLLLRDVRKLLLTATSTGDAESLTVSGASASTTDGHGQIFARTEEALVTFRALAAGQSVSIAGRTVTAGTKGLTAAEVTAAFGAGTLAVGKGTVSGEVSGWLLYRNSTPDQVGFLSHTEGQDIANLTAGGTTTAPPTISITQGHGVIAPTRETVEITFSALAAGQTLTIGGYSLTAEHDMSANEVSETVGGQIDLVGWTARMGAPVLHKLRTNVSNFDEASSVQVAESAVPLPQSEMYSTEGAEQLDLNDSGTLGDTVAELLVPLRVGQYAMNIPALIRFESGVYRLGTNAASGEAINVGGMPNWWIEMNTLSGSGDSVPWTPPEGWTALAVVKQQIDGYFDSDIPLNYGIVMRQAPKLLLSAREAGAESLYTYNLERRTVVEGRDATGDVTETASVNFGTLAKGQSLAIAGRTVTAGTKDLTAAEVATAFASGTLAVGKGTVSGALAGWTAAATGSNVSFTSTTANRNVDDLAIGGTAAIKPAVNKVQGSAASEATAVQVEVTLKPLVQGEFISIGDYRLTAGHDMSIDEVVARISEVIEDMQGGSGFPVGLHVEWAKPVYQIADFTMNYSGYFVESVRIDPPRTLGAVELCQLETTQGIDIDGDGVIGDVVATVLTEAVAADPDNGTAGVPALVGTQSGAWALAINADGSPVEAGAVPQQLIYLKALNEASGFEPWSPSEDAPPAIVLALATTDSGTNYGVVQKQVPTLTLRAEQAGNVADLACAGVKVVVTQGRDAAEGVTETASINFGTLAKGQSLAIAGRTVTAGTKDLTAAEVAAAFASGTLAVGKGTVSGALAGWTAAVNGNSITFTSMTANHNVEDLAIGGTAAAKPPVSKVQGAAPVDAAAESVHVEFKGLKAYDSLSIGDLTLTTETDMSATDVAAWAAHALAEAGGISGWSGEWSGSVLKLATFEASENGEAVQIAAPHVLSPLEIAALETRLGVDIDGDGVLGDVIADVLLAQRDSDDGTVPALVKTATGGYALALKADGSPLSAGDAPDKLVSLALQGEDGMQASAWTPDPDRIPVALVELPAQDGSAPQAALIEREKTKLLLRSFDKGDIDDIIVSGADLVRHQGRNAAEGLTETASVSFGTLAKGQSLAIAGRTVTAGTKDLTAAEVATAFASGTLAVGKGTVSGALAGWTAAVDGSSITFTSSSAHQNVEDLAIGGTAASKPAPVKVQGAAPVATAYETAEIRFRDLKAGDTLTIGSFSYTFESDISAQEIVEFLPTLGPIKYMFGMLGEYSTPVYTASVFDLPTELSFEALLAAPATVSLPELCQLEEYAGIDLNGDERIGDIVDAVVFAPPVDEETQEATSPALVRTGSDAYALAMMADASEVEAGSQPDTLQYLVSWSEDGPALPWKPADDARPVAIIEATQEFGGAGQQLLVERQAEKIVLRSEQSGNVEDLSFDGVNATITQGHDAIAGVTETATLTFGALAKGQTLSIAGLTVTAGAKGLTAVDLAGAFTSGTLLATKGTVSGTLEGWTVANAAGTPGRVSFTSKLAQQDVSDLVVGGSAATKPTIATVQGAAPSEATHETVEISFNSVLAHQTLEVRGFFGQYFYDATSAYDVASMFAGFVRQGWGTGMGWQVSVAAPTWSLRQLFPSSDSDAQVWVGQESEQIDARTLYQMESELNLDIDGNGSVGDSVDSILASGQGISLVRLASEQLALDLTGSAQPGMNSEDVLYVESSLPQMNVSGIAVEDDGDLLVFGNFFDMGSDLPFAEARLVVEDDRVRLDGMRKFDWAELGLIESRYQVDINSDGNIQQARVIDCSVGEYGSWQDEADIFRFTGVSDLDTRVSRITAPTAVIHDFETRNDTIQVGGFHEGVVSEGSFRSMKAFLLKADRDLNGYVNAVIGTVGSDVYVATDDDGTGITNLIKIVGAASDPSSGLPHVQVQLYP